ENFLNEGQARVDESPGLEKLIGPRSGPVQTLLRPHARASSGVTLGPCKETKARERGQAPALHGGGPVGGHTPGCRSRGRASVPADRSGGRETPQRPGRRVPPRATTAPARFHWVSRSSAALAIPDL